MIHDALKRKTYSITADDLVTLLRTLDNNIPEGSKVVAWSVPDNIGDVVYFHIFHESMDEIVPGVPEDVTEL